MAVLKSKEKTKQHDWTFLSNHGHILILLHKNPGQLLREVALTVGITERAVISIVKDLVEAGALEKTREGRRNYYKVNTETKLRHPIEAGHSIKELLRLAK
jgi:predicted transcriptional regulator